MKNACIALSCACAVLITALCGVSWFAWQLYSNQILNADATHQYLRDYVVALEHLKKDFPEK